MNKRLLILGAGEMQVPVIRKANDMGLHTIVADMDANAPGMGYASEPVLVSTMDKEGVLECAKRHSVDGILTTSDAPVNVVSYVGEQLGLPSMSTEVAKICTNKYLQREMFAANGIDVPFFMLCDKDTDLGTLQDYPYIVKPVDSSASREVKKVTNHKELVLAFSEALGYSRTGKAIVEGFITGREFSVETYTQNNKTTVVTITEKLCIGEAEGFFVEDTHIEPARITKQEWELVSETVSKALCLIGLNNCPSHTEIKLNESGAYIIEIACRLGGDYITSDLVPLSTGIDMLRNLVNCSLGLPVDVLRKHEKCSAVQFLNPLNYQRCVDFLSSSRSSAVFRSEIRPYSEKKIKNSLDRLGYIILQTDSMEELESILRTIK